MIDTTTFPDPTYKDTVLAPLFEGVKTHYAQHMAAINRAHLVMLSETGILTSDQTRKIAKALHEIDAETDIDALTYTGEHEDYFFVVEAALRDKLGDLGGALHTARSRNDMDHTLFKLALMQRGDDLMDKGIRLAQSLLAKAKAERDTLIVAYTHGQPAQPSTFGHYIAAILEGLIHDLDRISMSFDALEECPMGAAAITTSGFPIDRERMAQLLGFTRPKLNSYGCIASIDYVTAHYSAIKLLFLHLGRVIQDMAFWSSFEVGQLYVPNSLVQISSIMPQKRNPVPIEHMRHLASVTVGRCDMIVNTMHNTPFTDMNDSEGEVQQAGYATFASGGRVLDLLNAFLPACSINSDKVRRNTDAACITITELADTLVRDEGLTFRQAHEIAAATAKAVIARGVALSGGFDAFAQAFEHEVKRTAKLDATAFQTAVAPETFVARRDRTGGPAPAAMDAAFAIYAEGIADLTDWRDARRHLQTAARTELDTTFSALMET